MSADGIYPSGSHSQEVAAAAAEAITSLKDRMDSRLMAVKSEIDRLEARFDSHLKGLQDIMEDVQVIDRLVRTGFYGQRPLIEVVPQLQETLKRLEEHCKTVMSRIANDARDDEIASAVWRIPKPKTWAGFLAAIAAVLLFLLMLGTFIDQAPAFIHVIEKVMKPL